jgi:repressor LexA
MTEKQEKIYNIVKKFIDENGYAPSVREIGKIAGVTSTATVFDHMKKLKEKGYINYIKGKPRTIRIVK